MTDAATASEMNVHDTLSPIGYFRSGRDAPTIVNRYYIYRDMPKVCEKCSTSVDNFQIIFNLALEATQIAAHVVCFLSTES